MSIQVLIDKDKYEYKPELSRVVQGVGVGSVIGGLKGVVAPYAGSFLLRKLLPATLAAKIPVNIDRNTALLGGLVGTIGGGVTGAVESGIQVKPYINRRRVMLRKESTEIINTVVENATSEEVDYILHKCSLAKDIGLKLLRYGGLGAVLGGAKGAVSGIRAGGIAGAARKSDEGDSASVKGTLFGAAKGGLAGTLTGAGIGATGGLLGAAAVRHGSHPYAKDIVSGLSALLASKLSGTPSTLVAASYAGNQK